jgi:hypothetical protein
MKTNRYLLILPENLVQVIDERRGNVSRPAYLRAVLCRVHRIPDVDIKAGAPKGNQHALKKEVDDFLDLIE